MRRTALLIAIALLAMVGFANPAVAAPGSQDPVKGPPPSVDGRGPRSLADGGTTFLYAFARQYGQADGAYGSYTVAQPYVDSAGGHSLAELAVQSADGQQIVEVGWTVDRGLNGDVSAHLFVYHWVDHVPSCYNACGFVPADTTGGPGTPLATGSVHQFMIIHDHGNWWIGDNYNWLGYYPDSLWPNVTPSGTIDGSKFTKAGRVDWFGEVASHTATPCSDMGNGQFSVSAGAARIDAMGYFGGPAANPDFQATLPAAYTVTPNDGNNMRFGGPGACPRTPDITGRTVAYARSAIARAGLVVGVVGTTTDWLCEDLGKVTTQTPATGFRLQPGGRVDFVYAVPPATGCPNPRA